jgi:predicted aspartyl protease
MMTKAGDNGMGRILVQVELTNAEDVVRAKDGSITPDKVRRLIVEGTVDTGANYLVLSGKMVKDLGLPDSGETFVRYADRRRGRRRMVENVRVDLLGRHGIFRALVEPRRDTALIGAVVLEDLDMVVDCRTQTIRPRDPRGIIGELE